MPTSASPPPKKNRPRKLVRLLVLLFLVTAMGWLGYGHHRRVPAQLLAEASKRGLVIQSAERTTGALSTSLQTVRVTARDNPRLTVEIRRLGIRHWPFMRPQVSLEGVSIHLQGDPRTHLRTLASTWFVPQARLEVGPMEMTYEHRLLGEIHLTGVVLEPRGDAFALEAAQARLGALTWPDVRVVLEQRKGAAIVTFGTQAGQGGAELSCFPSERGTSRWLLNLPHGPVRPLLQGLGVDLGEEFSAARMAGSLGLDIPDDEARPIRGRVQIVMDDWPLFAPAEAEPMLGRTFSLLSNVNPSADGSRWELPRAELTMPVFSLAGKGSLQLGRDTRLILEVEGERTCRQLRGLLPPSQARDEVRHFLEKKGRSTEAEASAGVKARWDTANATGPFRPAWDFMPGCGIGAWPKGVKGD